MGSPDGSEILIVDDDPAQCRIVAFWLEEVGHTTLCVDTGEGCLSQLRHSAPDAVLLDLDLPDVSGLEILEKIRRHNADLPVVILTANDRVETVIDAMQRRATDYLVKPLEKQRLLVSAQNAIAHYRTRLRLQSLEKAVETTGFGGIVGASGPMRTLYQRIARVAPTDVTVLIRGESGTGKELVARALHDEGVRREGPFVAINCAAIPETMQEAELFGHEKGAFTGALNRRTGRFEQADGGTLFLDEVAELSPPLQAKLLRALQQQSFYRVGGAQSVSVDVRFIAATHRDLRARVREGRFREDLFYRLAVYDLSLPPLRERPGDVALLSKRFVQRYGAELQRNVQLDNKALGALQRYAWPGNVRELQNVIQQAILNCPDDTVRLEDLPEVLSSTAFGDMVSLDEMSSLRLPPVSLEELERAAIEAAMKRHQGCVSDVAQELKIARTTLYRKLKTYDIS